MAGDDESTAAPQRHAERQGQACRGDRRRRYRIGLYRHVNRQGAASVTQLEIMPKPPEKENKALTWPDWPLKLRTSSSHEEGCERDWAVLTKRVVGKDGKVQGAGMRARRMEARRWRADGLVKCRAANSSSKADLVLLAMGFVGPRQAGLVEQAGVELDPRGNVEANVAGLQDQHAEDFLLRRHAARPIAGRLGDPRGPAVRARGRRVPDGSERTAAIGREAP